MARAFHVELDGEKVKQAREDCGMTVNALAESAEVSPSLIYSIQNGYRKSVGDSFAQAIARSLGIELDKISCE
jgi:transcriptional regulator with XRE-family HTH domain